MSQRNWNRNVIFLTVIIQIKRIAASDNITPTVATYNPECEYVFEGGYLTAKCGKGITNEHKDRINHLSSKLQKNIQAIEFIPDDTTEYIRYTFYHRDFIPFTQLKRILIRRVQPMVDRINMYSSYMECFKDLKSVEYFEFTSSNLSEEYTIAWPKNLKVLKLDDNEFKRLDIKECPVLHELSVNQNQLQDIPKFHYRSVPVKILRLKGNPLDNMTILSLAPLCELTVLELEFPPGSHYSQRNSIMSYCDCLMLKKWSEETSISGPEHITCHKPKQNFDICSQAIYEKAKKLHRGCPILKSNHSAPIVWLLETVFLIVIGLMLIAAVALFIYRHFQLKEKWISLRDKRTAAKSSSKPVKRI